MVGYFPLHSGRNLRLRTFLFVFSGARVAHWWALSASWQGRCFVVTKGGYRKVFRYAGWVEMHNSWFAKVVHGCTMLFTLWMLTFLGYQQIQPFDYIAIGGGGRWTSELWGVLHAGQWVERQRRLGVSKNLPFKRQKVVVYVHWNLSSRSGELKNQSQTCWFCQLFILVLSIKSP